MSERDPGAPKASISRKRAAALTTESKVKVHLFGGMHVERCNRPLPGFACSKAGELLAYLLLHRDRPQRRERLAEILWGDELDDPRRSIRQALWRLRSNLGTEDNLFDSVDEERISVNPGAALWLDVAVFEYTCREIQAAGAGDLTASTWPRAKAALELYRGELLDGTPWDWCRFERVRLHDLFLALGDQALLWCLDSSDFNEGIRLGFEMLRYDPAREKTHRALMLLHATAGDRSSALRQFDLCVAALREDLGVAPGQSTRELAERIVEDRMAGRSTLRQRSTQKGVERVLRGLQELRELLSDARREVHVEIEAIERELKGHQD